jgi:hypothetical protein
MADTMNVALAQALRLKSCHALAIGLYRRNAASIVLIIDDSRNIPKPYTRDVSMFITAILAQTSDGLYVDVDGTCSADDVDARYLRRNDGSQFRLIKLANELALAPFTSTDWDYQLRPLTEAEIESSLQDHDHRKSGAAGI